jgi:hypothetical protein
MDRGAQNATKNVPHNRWSMTGLDPKIALNPILFPL